MSEVFSSVLLPNLIKNVKHFKLFQAVKFPPALWNSAGKMEPRFLRLPTSATREDEKIRELTVIM